MRWHMSHHRVLHDSPRGGRSSAREPGERGRGVGGAPGTAISGPRFFADSLSPRVGASHLPSHPVRTLTTTILTCHLVYLDMDLSDERYEVHEKCSYGALRKLEHARVYSVTVTPMYLLGRSIHGQQQQYGGTRRRTRCLMDKESGAGNLCWTNRTSRTTADLTGNVEKVKRQLRVGLG